MIWPTYEVKGRHKDTNRYRTTRITAVSLENCRAQAINQGLMEPLEISVSYNKPTQKQIEYVVSIGYEITSEMTFEDVSALLDRYENDDNYDPNPELLEYANSKGFNFSNFVGKKALYNIIFDRLKGKEKIAFFIFYVYRWLSDDRKANLDKHPYRDKFLAMADTLVGNDQFEKSMNKYRGQELRYFGELIVNSVGSFGGSVNTIAYKTVIEMLSKEFGLKNQKVKTIQRGNKKSQNIEPLGANNTNEHKGFAQSFISRIFKTK